MTLRIYFQKNNKKSSPWRIWGHKEDLYATARNLGGIFKASLHQSGFLNFSFVNEYFKQDKITPVQESRHIGQEKLNIDFNANQPVFFILIPIYFLSECSFKESKMQKIEIDKKAIGTIRIIIVHICHKKRHIDYSNIPNFLGTLCNNRYIIYWDIENKILNSVNTSKVITLDDPILDSDTRLITHGYSIDNKSGMFLDTLYTAHNSFN